MGKFSLNPTHLNLCWQPQELGTWPNFATRQLFCCCWGGRAVVRTDIRHYKKMATTKANPHADCKM